MDLLMLAVGILIFAKLVTLFEKLVFRIHGIGSTNNGRRRKR